MGWNFSTGTTTEGEGVEIRIERFIKCLGC
jgi:hypothetical protein